MSSDDVFGRFPILELDDSIILREISLKDSQYYYRYLSDPEVNKFVSSDDIPKDLKSAENELIFWGGLFRQKRSVYWGVADRKSNKLIGTCGFNSWHKTHDRVEISYDLDKDYWNKSIATRLVKIICEFAFVKMKVVRVQATVATENFASIRVLEKNKFKQEGLMRKYGSLHNQFRDFYMYGLLVEDL